ncbi:hypothetical protein Ddc_22355 [Ditylenchus destructor]|nr:hypothetical protein Ddc_22355 [Ditylenchus destructor]
MMGGLESALTYRLFLPASSQASMLPSPFVSGDDIAALTPRKSTHTVKKTSGICREAYLSPLLRTVPRELLAAREYLADSSDVPPLSRRT